MKKLYKLVTLLMIFGLFTACSSSDDDNNAKITILKTDYTVGAEQDSEVIATFTINVDWTTSKIIYVGDSKDWLTVTSSGKAGTDQTITMKAAENSAGTERTASFDINYGGKQKKLTVTQLAKSADPTLTISTSEFTVNGEADSEAIATFSVNVDWETSVIIYVGDAKDWLTIAPIEGKAGTDRTITMKVAENLAVIDRTASFDIKYGGKYHKLTITQAFQVDANITAHFDATFAAKLQEKGYIPDATKIFFSEVRNITEINIEGEMSDKDPTSLSGIEYFKSLTKLIGSYNKLTSLDVSKNTKLTWLECQYNQISYLDLSKNIALVNFDCQKNKLTSLDVSMNPDMTTLFCSDNKLGTLDVSKNTKLIHLVCVNNQLTAIDVSKNIVLEQLNCSVNKLTSLDLSKNTALTNLLCFGNQLTSLDISKNRALTDLWCAGNPGNGTLFIIKAWFDSSAIPSPYFPKVEDPWDFEGNTITVYYQKVD